MNEVFAVKVSKGHVKVYKNGVIQRTICSNELVAECYFSRKR